MSLSNGHLSVTCQRDTAQTFTLTLREDTKNLQLGFIEITLVPTGARVECWNGDDDSAIDTQIVLRAEKPS